MHTRGGVHSVQVEWQLQHEATNKRCSSLIDLLFCVGRSSSTVVAVDPERDAHKQIEAIVVILSYYPTLMHINGKSVLHKR